MENEKTFKTKTGFCHILPNKIILTREGIIGNVAKVTVGKNITRILIIYSGLSTLLLYSAFNSFQKGQVHISTSCFRNLQMSTRTHSMRQIGLDCHMGVSG